MEHAALPPTLVQYELPLGSTETDPQTSTTDPHDAPPPVHLPSFTFASLTEEDALSCGGLAFCSEALECDYTRFTLCGSSSVRSGCMVSVACVAALVSLFAHAASGKEPWVVNISVIGFCGTLVLGLILAACGRADAPATVLDALLCMIMLLFQGTVTIYATGQIAWECGEAAGGASNDATACAATPSAIFIAVQFTLLVWTRKRARRGVPLLIVGTVCYILFNAFMWPELDAGQQGFVALGMVAGVATVIALGLIYESGMRTAFLRLYLTAVAQQRILEHAAAVQRIGRVALPEHLHPLVTEALALADVGIPLHTACASVCVFSISDSIIGCRGVACATHVEHLVRVVTVLDTTAALFGVHRAVGYGDYYVTEAGLTTANRDDHGDVMIEFGQWASRKMASAGVSCVPLLTVRAAVSTGPLSCAVIGQHARRYVLAGPALQRAVAALATATERFVDARPAPELHEPIDLTPMLPALQRKEWGDAAPATQFVAALDRHVYERDSSIGAPPVDAASPVNRHLSRIQAALAQHFNDVTCLGDFHSEIVRAGQLRFAAAEEQRFGFYANVAMIVLVVGAFLVPVSRWLAAGATSRWRVAAGLACAACCVVLFVVRAIRLRASGPLPLVVDCAVLYVAGFLHIAAIGFVAGTAGFTPNPQVGLLLAGLFIVFTNRRVHWIAPCCASLVHSALSAAMTIAFGGTPVGTTLRRVAVVLVALWIFAWQLYRDVQRRYAVTAAALAVSRLSVENVKTQRALVEQLMPPPLVDATVEYLADPAAGAAWHVFDDHEMAVFEGTVSPMTYCRDCPIASAACRPSSATTPEDLLEFWSGFAAVVEESCQRLALVQVVGDRFMIAGPYKHSATRRLNAAVRELVTVARRLVRAAARARMQLLGVAHVDLAYAAVVGSTSAVFRVLGPACRQTHALLAGAPDVGQSAVFATSAVPGFFDATDEDYSNESSLCDACDVTPAVPPQPLETSQEVFAGPMRWRVSGGPAIVYALRLPPTPVLVGDPDETRSTGSVELVADDPATRCGSESNPLVPE